MTSNKQQYGNNRNSIIESLKYTKFLLDHMNQELYKNQKKLNEKEIEHKEIQREKDSKYAPFLLAKLRNKPLPKIDIKKETDQLTEIRKQILTLENAVESLRKKIILLKDEQDKLEKVLSLIQIRGIFFYSPEETKPTSLDLLNKEIGIDSLRLDFNP